VTAGRNVTVAGNSILQPGLWGADIEPDGGDTGAVRVTVSENLFTPGAGFRPFVQAVGSSGGGTVSGIAVVGNTVQGAPLTTQFVPAAGQRWSGITFSGNTSDTPGALLPGGARQASAVVTMEDIDGVIVAGNRQPGSGDSRHSCALRGAAGSGRWATRSPVGAPLRSSSPMTARCNEMG
jgi:hypothetical protein